MHLDQLDLELLNLLLEEPQAGMREYARVLGNRKLHVMAGLLAGDQPGETAGPAGTADQPGEADPGPAWPPAAARTNGSTR